MMIMKEINVAIYITGDKHGNIRGLSSANWETGRYLSREDYLVILGDFGLVWSQEESDSERYWLDWLNDKPWTTLFIDGNHENFDRLNQFPVEEWHGGCVHKVRENVIHLMRGYVFDIDGKKCFTMGGAPSHDIEDGIYDSLSEVPGYIACNMYARYRINHLSWWAEEMPSLKEYKRANRNLAEANYEVDFIFTHEAPCSAKIFLGYYDLKRGDNENLSMWLNTLLYNVKYSRWYFGHYHCERVATDRCECLYDKIIQIA